MGGRRPQGGRGQGVRTTRCRRPGTRDVEDRIFGDPLRRVRPPQAPRHRAAGDQADGRRDPRRPEQPDLPAATATTPTSRSTASTDIIDCAEDVAELEALHRWAMVLHNQYPWDRAQAELVEVGELDDDDYVVVFAPARPARSREFLRRVEAGAASPSPAAPRAGGDRRRSGPIPPVDVRKQFAVMPRIEALAVVHGEQRLHQRGPDPQRRLQLVADDRRRDPRQDRDRAAALHRADAGGDRPAGGRGGARARRARTRGDRRGARSAPAPAPG